MKSKSRKLHLSVYCCFFNQAIEHLNKFLHFLDHVQLFLFVKGVDTDALRRTSLEKTRQCKIIIRKIDLLNPDDTESNLSKEDLEEIDDMITNCYQECVDFMGKDGENLKKYYEMIQIEEDE